MAQSANAFQQVSTYNKSGLAFLLNSFGIISNCNTKFNDFDKIYGNLGSSVTFDKKPRMTTVNSLVAQFQGVNQRVETLTVNNQISSSFEVSDQQKIFNMDPMNYMEQFGKSAITEIGTEIETNLANDFVTAPYRFYGNGVTPINSYGQLADALMYFRNYGAVKTDTVGFLADTIVPGIINSGLNQFAPDRNDEISNSWELGRFNDCAWKSSNLLATHIAGTEGQNGTTLTVVSTTEDANGNITAITFSGTTSASDADSVKQYDRFQFNDNVGSLTNLRFLTFIGKNNLSANAVQFQAKADAASTSGSQVTVTLKTPLIVGQSVTDSVGINAPIVAGMQVSVLPSHRTGVIYSGKPHFCAMPSLGDQSPYTTAYMPDETTGISIRQTMGTVFGQNQRGMIYDAIWGSKLVGENAMALIFPI